MQNAIFQVDCVGISDPGLVRENNEDVWAAYSELGLFLLADGMGGHAGGEVASKKAVDDLSGLVKKWNPTKQTTEDQAIAFFREALEQVNAQIYCQGYSDESLSGMGTTLCVLYLLHSHAILAHVGDSRIYRLRDQTLSQLTEDHSLVSELVSLGAMKLEETSAFAYKHILTRAIGTQPKVESTINFLGIQPNDMFMLCSDGLTNFVNDTEITQVLTQKESLQTKAQQLVDLANEHGGGDNVTIILVDVGDDLSRQ